MREFPWIFVLLLPLILLVSIVTAAYITKENVVVRDKDVGAKIVDTHKTKTPAKESVEMQIIPLRDLEQQKAAAPYVSIPAPFKISTTISQTNIKF